MLQIIDGTTATMDKRKQIHDYFARKLGYKVLFVELIVQDEELLEHNVKVRQITLFEVM